MPIVDSIPFDNLSEVISSLNNTISLMNTSSTSTMEPKRDPLSTVIPMTILYALILVTGVIGNVSTCIVITRNKHMKTATNYYLFSLAVSDLLLLILGLPQELYMLWQKYPYAFGEPFCILRGLTSETSTNASVLTITAFTVERYVAICHPLRAHTMSKLSRAVRLIVIIWICATLGALPLAAQFGIKYEYINGVINEESAECTVKRPIDYAFETSTFIFFAIPITIICVLYMFIGIELRRSETINRGDQATRSSLESGPQNGHLNSSQLSESSPRLPLKGKRVSVFSKNGSVYTKFRSRKTLRSHAMATSIRGSGNSGSRRAVVKMLVAVVITFFLCWTPFHAQRLMAIHVKHPTAAEEMIFHLLTYISGVTYYVSATVNPILYSIMSLKFRQAFKDTLGRCWGRRSHTTRFGKFGSASSSRLTSTIRSTNGPESEISFVSDAMSGVANAKIARRSSAVEYRSKSNYKYSSVDSNYTGSKRGSVFSEFSCDSVMVEPNNTSFESYSDLLMNLTKTGDSGVR